MISEALVRRVKGGRDSHSWCMCVVVHGYGGFGVGARVEVVDGMRIGRSVLVEWLECRFLDTEVDGSNPSISMLCPLARHFIRIASVDSAVKRVPCGDNLVKGVQCYELFGGIALKNHAFYACGTMPGGLAVCRVMPEHFASAK